MPDHRQEPRVSSVLPSSEADALDSLLPAGSPKVDYQEPEGTNKGVSGFVIFMLFLLSVGALAVAGYLFLQASDMSKSLSQQQARIVELEGRLSMAGDESTQSLTEVSSNLEETSARLQAVNKQLEQANAEIAKLWTSSKESKTQLSTLKAQAANSVSQAKLDKLSASIGLLNKRVDSNNLSVNATIESLNKSSKALPQSVAKQNKIIDQLASTGAKNTQEQALLLKTLREKLADQNNQLKKLSSKVTSLQTASGPSDGSSAIEKTVRDNQNAIKAIDVFRQTVSRDLIQLKERINTQ